MALVRSNQLPVTHAGIIFKKRILERHNITVSDAAKLMHIGRPHLSKFASGKVAVTAPLAMKLEKSTGISAGFWMNIQKSYDLYIHRDLEIEAEPLPMVATG
ncbi:HigA family addiction module antitoxin [Thalassomonas haliotis]|uniref:HigA family addiction module antidote protein n=1 Tax=Thalassomonas haliotis TaxID=485448 RepID=A0ABY7VBP2_9GAMM|nr:HigA family addiction module antitoxin [Thalassomonas haliotis]WDE11060.1 HigA family addiction module antidote protein [Thalassomonas haliotis]